MRDPALGAKRANERRLTPSYRAQVANAGVIKAGHTGWNQSCITAQNIVNMISAENAPDAASVADPSASIVSPAFVHYEPSPPQIKVTTGLVSPSCYLFLSLQLFDGRRNGAWLP